MPACDQHGIRSGSGRSGSGRKRGWSIFAGRDPGTLGNRPACL